jgi:hypothetical protein
MKRSSLLVAVFIVSCSHSKSAPAPVDERMKSEAATTGAAAMPSATEASPNVDAKPYLKPGAPVRVESSVSDTAVKLTLRFESAGSNVSVAVRGLDGLELKSATQLMKGASVKAQEAQVFELSFVPVKGEATVGVYVDGEFGGARQTRVATVTVGKPNPNALTTSDSMTTDSGLKLKLMPAAK